MSTIIIVSVVVLISCAFALYVGLNAEDKTKHKAPPHKHV